MKITLTDQQHATIYGGVGVVVDGWQLRRVVQYEAVCIETGETYTEGSLYNVLAEVERRTA